MLDILDGKQARDTGSSSPLGLLGKNSLPIIISISII